MSYLHVLDCYCQIGGSADVESVGGIDALLTNEEASVFALLETSSELASPCRSDTKFEFPDVVFTIGERGPDRYPPLQTGTCCCWRVKVRGRERDKRLPYVPKNNQVNLQFKICPRGVL